jgi:hypothetical protein
MYICMCVYVCMCMYVYMHVCTFHDVTLSGDARGCAAKELLELVHDVYMHVLASHSVRQKDVVTSYFSFLLAGKIDV